MSEYVWLNELSQHFLDKDYLVDGQTVDSRVDEICYGAEKLLDKPGFAARFKENIKKGWYSLSTPIWTNFGNDRGMPISCVVGDTWINTKIDGGKQAKDIEIGDEVLTHKGRYQKVTKIIVTPEKSDIYCLKVSGRMTNLHLTGDHLVLTNLGWVRTDELDVTKHLVAVNRNIEIESKNYSINMRNFTNHDYVEKNNRIYKAGSKKVRLDRRVEIVSYCAAPFSDIEIDQDLSWAMGLWFAEGSLIAKSSGIAITTNSEDEKPLAERWLKIIKNKFGINGLSKDCEIVRNGKKNKWTATYVSCKTVGKLFGSFGKNCKNKTIPNWIINLPNNILSSFLEGLLSGDGSIRKNGSIKITLANPKLILQIYQIGLKLGKFMSLQMQDKAGKLSSTSHVYTIVFRSEKLGVYRFSGRHSIPFNDGLSYSPIKLIKKTSKVETVYDFTVENDHSFSAAGVILHNCFGSFISDDMASIAYTHSEVMMMTKYGGGTSAYFGKLRGRGERIRKNGESSGSVHFMQLFDNLIQVISQGCTRRGNFAAYLPLDHKDIEEFLELRSEGNSIQDLSFGVCAPKGWMQSMIDGDPHKRKVWAKVIECRSNTGFPYVVFMDNVNDNLVDVYRDKGLEVSNSNLCSEIMLPNSELESFVCDLSSMNILYYDAWKNTDAVELLAYFLDAVMTEFINKAKKIPFMDRAVRFAENHRALGIGWLGWHSYLQSRMIPFESMEAKNINVMVAKTIKEKAYAASARMAQEYGEPELLKGYGRRNSTLLAIAPTKSSAFIMGQVSENIEPVITNYYIKDLAKGKYSIKNPYLEKLLISKDQNTDENWLSILKSGGSVQHLKFLSDTEKSVFKTFAEISPREVIIQAAGRQKYIDQSQSLNLMIHPSIPTKDINALMIEAWRLGVKSLYYQIGVSAAQNFSRNILACTSCE